MTATHATVRTLGGLLSPDLLARVGALSTDVEGLRPTDYGLDKGARLRAHIERSWQTCAGAWERLAVTRATLDSDAPGTEPTRRFLLTLLGELGWGDVPRSGVIRIGDRDYPVSHDTGEVPLHLLGVGVPLDRRTPGIAGAARTSPHAMVQQLLNRSEERLWGIVANGLQLRVLRDNLALSRQAFVEFDLEAMFGGAAYADFVLLWLVVHRSRFTGVADDSGRVVAQRCWLERWVTTAEREGVRALNSLRDGVQRALEELGTGFLAHPANSELREALTGQLTAPEYWRQLLRLIYQLLFVLVAEDRDVLLLAEGHTKPDARERYSAHYSLGRLRRLARVRAGTKHGDLWQGLRVVLQGLGSADGIPALAIPALGGQMFAAEATPALAGCQLRNSHLLQAIRALTWVHDPGTRRTWQVDYRNLGR